MTAAPNFWFGAASFLTKNGILNIVEQLGPNTKNLVRLESPLEGRFGNMWLMGG